MQGNIRRVAIIGGSRIPFCRSFSHYAQETNEDLLTAAIKGVVDRFQLRGKEMGEVAAGAVMKRSSDWNLTRECAIGAGLSPLSPANDVIRACGTGLEAAIQVANKIALGQIEVGIAGGTDTNSDLPLVLSRPLTQRLIKSMKAKSWKDRVGAWPGLKAKDLKPVLPAVVEPRTHMSMGEHCEKMAQEWGITRREQDELALASHQKGDLAYKEGFYDDLMVAYKKVKRDENLRGDSTIEKMGKLSPAFERGPQGTLTAANSTPLSDGASAILLASEEYAQKNNLPVLAYITHCQSSAVDFVGGEGLLMAPTVAVAKMLKRANLALSDFDFYEIHEAFAAQVLCTLKAWEDSEYCQTRLGLTGALGSIDRKRLNVKGGSLALGHPFAATGGRILASLAKMIHQQGRARGLVSICTGGGMGVVAILEK